MQVLPFSLAQCRAWHLSGVKKSGIWVLKDEILRCAQNDKGGALGAGVRLFGCRDGFYSSSTRSAWCLAG
jgi:hypothetical protein